MASFDGRRLYLWCESGKENGSVVTTVTTGRGPAVPKFKGDAAASHAVSDIESRLDAVERALTETDRGPGDLPDAAETTDRLADCEARLDDLEARLAELEAAVEAVRGYVGQARREDREAERTAEAALAAAERVERRLDGTTPPDPEPLPLVDDAPAPGVDADRETDADEGGPLARLRDAL